MNFPWLLIALIVIILIFAIVGYKKGFSAMLISLLSTVAAIVLLGIFAPKLTTLLEEKTGWDDAIENRVAGKILEKVKTDAELEEKVNGYPLPSVLKQKLLDRIKKSNDTVADKAHAIGKETAHLVLSVGVYVAGFIILLILFKLLGKVLDLVAKLPVLKQLNEFLGVLLSLIEALILIEVLFFILSAIADTGVGQVLMKQVEGSKILTWVYDHNLFHLFF